MDAPDETVHQHITNESQLVWKLIPYEIKDHLTNRITATLLDGNYDIGNDIITGSAEEDKGPENLPFLQHFWQPDDPDVFMGIALYDNGLFLSPSSYRRAMNIWTKQVIPHYLAGDRDQSYYHLGRVAHLLEDASQPGHVHLDSHLGHQFYGLICGGLNDDCDDSILEGYTGENFPSLQDTDNWQGENYEGQQYNYDALPNMQGFNWDRVDPNNPIDKKNIELFRLFWYTAQKTQYFASDDVAGNTVYVDTNGITRSFTTSLWLGDGATIISNPSAFNNEDYYWSQTNNHPSCITQTSVETCLSQSLNFPCYLCNINDGPNIQTTTNAVIPHAMKAVAGLYRLFWDSVHSYSWPTYRHDNRRTGFTILKGDMTTTSKKKGMNMVLSDGITTDAFARPSIADLDLNGKNEIIVAFSQSTNNGWINAIEMKKNGKSKELWSKSIGEPVSSTPSLGNIDNDEDLEVVVGLRNGMLTVINPNGNNPPPTKWTYTAPAKYSQFYGQNIRGDLGFSAIEDLDHDGRPEIIFTDYLLNFYDWSGDLYILRDNGATYTLVDTITVNDDGGAQGAPAIANIDSDDNEEIIIPGYYGLKVYDFNNDVLTQRCSNNHAKILSTPVIYDIDRDNEYEIIYTTTDTSCSQGGCLNKLYIVNANNCGTVERSISTGIYSLVSPGIANLDADSNLELVVVGRMGGFGTGSKVKAYDAVTGSLQWSYPSSGSLGLNDAAPNIADINGDGNMEIILVKNTSEILILNKDGSVYDEFSVGGKISSVPAIGDLTGKGVAELAVKRAGSPYAIVTTLTGNNSPPILNNIENIAALVGDLININQSGEILATDQENNPLTFSYSSPFNQNGLWQTVSNNSGNYSILIEASDGNLYDTQEINVVVFNESMQVENTFTSGQPTETLNFNSPGTQTVTVRIPADAEIIYSSITLEGSAP